MMLPLAPRSVSLVLTALLLSASAASSLSAQIRKLNAPLVPEGDVFTFEISPDGVHVLYLADQELNDRRDLYAARFDGTAPPVRLNPAWATATRDVDGYVLTPDGTRVVYRADQDSQDVFELFGVPVDGSSSAVRLHTPLVAGGDVSTDFVIAPDGSRVVYLADAEVDEVRGLYSAAVAGGPSAVKLSGSLALPSYSYPLISADSSRVVFQSSSGELHVVPLDGSAPPLKLNDPGTAQNFQLDPLGERVVFRNDVDDGIYSVPLDGSELPVRLNLGTHVGDYGITADGARVVYGSKADLVHEELFSAPIDGSAPQTSIGGPLVAGTRLWRVEISPDSSRAVFLTYSQGGPPPSHQLFGTPIDGSTPPVDLTAGVPMNNTTISVSAFDQRVVFLGAGWTSLHAVPADGSAAPTLLTPPGLPSIDLNVGLVLLDGDRRIAFVSQGRLYEAPLDGSAAARVVHPPMTAGGNVTGFRENDSATPHAAVLGRGKVLVYRADQDADAVFELYACSLPPRASGVHGPPVDLR